MTSTSYDYWVSAQLEPTLILRSGRRYEEVRIEYPHDPPRDADYARRNNIDWQREVEEREDEYLKLKGIV